MLDIAEHVRAEINGLQKAMSVTECDRCRTNIRLAAKKVLSDYAARCWCGGEVGWRVPGDGVGLGCLENILHDWGATETIND